MLRNNGHEANYQTYHYTKLSSTTLASENVEDLARPSDPDPTRVPKMERNYFFRFDMQKY
jgi:hypothetical protein